MQMQLLLDVQLVAVRQTLKDEAPATGRVRGR